MCFPRSISQKKSRETRTFFNNLKNVLDGKIENITVKVGGNIAMETRILRRICIVCVSVSVYVCVCMPIRI